MCSCCDQDKGKLFSIDLIDQKPIRCDVALTEIFPVSSQRMVTMLRRKSFFIPKQLHNVFQQGYVIFSPNGSFQVLFELIRLDDLIDHTVALRGVS